MKRLLYLLSFLLPLVAAAAPGMGGVAFPQRGLGLAPIRAASASAVTNATDDFNRADAATLGANWTAMTGEAGLAGINTQFGTNTDLAHDAHFYWSGSATPAFGGDHGSQITFRQLSGGTSSGGQGGGVSTRCQSAARTYYHAVANGAASGNIEFAKVILGSYTPLLRVTQAVAPGDKLALLSQGSTHTVYFNGTSIMSTNDASITGGLPGLAYSSTITAYVWDDWLGWTP